MKVEPTATAQPIAYPPRTTTAAGPDKCQTIPPTGRHCQNSSASSKLAHSTNVDRSAGAGNRRAQRRLNQGRAITLCWTANSSNSSRSAAIASGQAEGVPLSMPVGTPASAKKPIA